MDAKPGTYILILRSDARRTVQIGRWGELAVQLGYYLYVGSAFGPGGVRARVSRHARKGKTLRWHVDYLREVTELERVWYSYELRHLEHDWAQMLSGLSRMAAIKGFGCSDCNCEGHLFYADREPELIEFKRGGGGPLLSWEGNF